MSSLAGIVGLPARTGYSASKYALHGFLETLRIENLRNGLHVLMMCAGFTKSDIRKKALTADGTPQGFTPREEEKMMMPEEVALALIKAIKRRRNLVILTLEGKMTAIVKRIAPRLVEHVAYRKMAREPETPACPHYRNQTSCAAISNRNFRHQTINFELKLIKLQS